MGLFSSKSSSSTATSVNTTTNTTTTYRDIGLTGEAAVALADVVAGAGVEITRTGAGTLEKVTQQVGESYKQLIGGASDLVNLSGQQAQRTIESGERASVSIQAEARNLLDSAKSTAARIIDPTQQNNVMLAALAALGFVAFMALRK